MYIGVVTKPPDSTSQLGSELVMYSARLVRAMRRQLHLPAWVRVLSILDEFGPQGISHLAHSDNCSQPTMSAAVAGLVAHGLVTKDQHPTDARSSVITLTEQGRAELASVRSRHNAVVLDRLQASGRSLEDLTTAVAVMRDLVDPQA